MPAPRSAVTGSTAWPDLAHRGMLDPVPGFRPFQDSTVFDRIGGLATVDRLVDSLYDRFEADRAIRRLFGRDVSNQRRNQKRFFTEWLGGPPRYSESAWAALYQHHEDLPITRALAERWLGHLLGALRDAVPDENDGIIILHRARAVAFALVNDARDAMQSAGQAPGASKHRSERIASCGIGARTLNRAVRCTQHGKVDELAALVLEVPEVIDRAAFAARLLQSATLAGRIEVVEWLIDRGVDVNKPWPLPVSLIGPGLEGILFVTPLCAARMTHRSDLGTHLLRRGAREDVFTAAFLGDLPRLRQLLVDRPGLAQVSDPATDVLTITPIHHAVAGNQVAALRVLLDHTTERVRTGARALRVAAARGNRNMIELLLEHGADAHAIGAGRWVMDAGIAPLLAVSGASAGVGPSGEESADWVRGSCTGNQGRKDDPTYVASLLRYGARVDQRYNGATPLHYAAKAGFVRTIGVLLELGADRHARDDRGRQPRDWLGEAARSVDREAVHNVLETRSAR